MALIAAQKLQIAKLQRQIYGQRSERSTRLIDQLALEFEELAASAAEDELAAEQAAVKTTTVRPFTLVQDRNTPQKHVWRAEIVLLTADGVGTNAIMRRTGKSKTCVWRWQERFVEEGFDGLLHDKTRPSRIKPLGAEAAERVVALTLGEPPGETTHWTGVLMAKAAGLSVSSVQRIWRAHGLQPHRMRQFKLSNDPRFVDKLRNVVGLYVDPPAHAIVLSVDEKSQIQALGACPSNAKVELRAQDIVLLSNAMYCV